MIPYKDKKFWMGVFTGVMLVVVVGGLFAATSAYEPFRNTNGQGYLLFVQLPDFVLVRLIELPFVEDAFIDGENTVVYTSLSNENKVGNFEIAVKANSGRIESGIPLPFCTRDVVTGAIVGLQVNSSFSVTDLEPVVNHPACINS